MAEQVAAGISPRCQVVAGRAFSHRGVELIGERSLLSYINRVEGQRKQGIDPDADPLEIVEVADDDSPAEAASNRSTARETLRALSMEVASSSGVQFALNLGA
ncbi:MAG: hypothetical protein WAW17_16320 [Rhodococcus sp. (in: high G+C Gram-positive bacteria)]|uniref:hypothetical protein n=1 Tax=Rhodococcus sp. TaxID=1831 RepID=UPI003BB0A456